MTLLRWTAGLLSPDRRTSAGTDQSVRGSRVRNPIPHLHGLALARLNRCGEALKIAQTINDRIPSDETAIANAAEVVNICRANAEATPTTDLSQIEGTITPTPEATETPEPTATP